MGRFKLQIEEAFGKDRKLCKKNITQRTKYLIEKYQSKKKKKDTTLQAKILSSAKEQAQLVRLDFEMEKDKQQVQLREDESKYYQAIRKMKFNDHEKMFSQKSIALKKVKFNAQQDVKGVEKAIEAANYLCRSNLLKVGLRDL